MVNVVDYVLNNIECYRDLTSSLRKQKKDLLQEYDILMHDDIINEYEGLCFSAIVDDLSFRFGLPYDVVMVQLEDLDLRNILDDTDET